LFLEIRLSVFVIGVRNNHKNFGFVMFELSMIALSAWNLVPSGPFQVSDEFSNLMSARILRGMSYGLYRIIPASLKLKYP